MCGPGCYAVVTFLRNEAALGGVDEEFRDLVTSFHKIPYCASYGVSCAGHVYEIDENGKYNSDNPAKFAIFRLGLSSLDIAVRIDLPHIQELLKVIQDVVVSDADASFKRIFHTFGPANGGRLDVWEIEIGAGEISSKVIQQSPPWMLIAEYPELYELSKRRIKAIYALWNAIGERVEQFCQAHGFTEFDLESRTEELGATHDEDQIAIKSGLVPNTCIQKWECNQCGEHGEVACQVTASGFDVLRAVTEAHKSTSPDCSYSMNQIGIPRGEAIPVEIT